MAGHSKWANIKQRKEAQDAKKGKIFQKLAREIAVAARGGSNLENNSTLRLAVSKARTFNMPKDKIKAAIDKGSGIVKSGTIFVELTYEAKGHSGALMIIEVLTDKPSRVSPVIKNILTRHGWILIPSRSVLHAFRRAGRIVVARKDLSLDKMEEIIIESCVDDFAYDDEYYVLYCEVNDLEQMQKDLASNEITELIDISKGLFAKNEIKLTEQHKLQFNKLINALENEDDVTNIYHNVQ